MPENNHISWQNLTVNQLIRSSQKGQKACCIWLTGLSGSGKSTIANLLEQRLVSEGRHTYILDGDNVRHGLNSDLCFSQKDREENIRRVAEVAKLMVDAGLIVLVSFISPFAKERDFARSLFAPNEFFEVFVDAAVEDCEKRDPKGLYAKARAGLIPDFTGIDSPYEPPVIPEIHVKSAMTTPVECVEKIYAHIYHHEA